MSVIRELVASRLAALERGDKALGREIYHQLQNMGLRSDQIDGVPASHFDPAPVVREQETAVPVVVKGGRGKSGAPSAKAGD